jgi:hypothetical protein
VDVHPDIDQGNDIPTAECVQLILRSDAVETTDYNVALLQSIEAILPFMWEGVDLHAPIEALKVPLCYRSLSPP